MIAGIVVTHGSLGKAVLDAVFSIAGDVSNLMWISNEGLSAAELSGAIADAARTLGDLPVVIFVDVFGGSCWRAAKTARVSDSTVVTGFNLAMLLSFVHKRDSVPFSDLAAVLDTDARRGIRVD